MNAIRYYVSGDLLLDDYEWAGGIRPDPKIVAQRRGQIAEGTAFAGSTLPSLDELPIAPPVDYERAMHDAVLERNRTLGRLGTQARLVARVEQGGCGPLFGDDQASLF